MEIAKIQVSSVQATVVYQEPVPSGIIGATITVEYTDPVWENLHKTVVFNGCTTKDVLDSGNVVAVPPEVVATPGSELLISFYGVGKENELAVPTLRVSLGEIMPAANPSGDSSTSSTLPVWAQLQQEIGALNGNGSTGGSGATFTPAVSEDGVLSWTNNRGLENPEPVNLKGDTGAAGYTPLKGVDYYTDADKAEMVEEVKSSMDGIPDYWKDHLDSKIAMIRSAMLTAGANKSAFFFYSDSHWSNETTYTAKMAPVLLKYLCKNTPINKTNFGGDIVRAEAAEAETMAYLWEWRNLLYGLPNHHSVVGNHDDGNTTNHLFSESYVYGYLLAPEETCDIVRGDSGMYYYIDNPTEKTRYLYLDTAYQGVTDAQQAFVESALLSTPENWHIVAIAHAWYHNDYTTNPPVLNGFDTNAKILLDMFDKYNARSDEYAECLGWVEFCIGGHYHLDHIEHTTGGIPVIIVEADCLHDRSGTMPSAGTTDEAAVSAVIADYNEKTVSIIRIGRGEDYSTIIVSQFNYTNVIPLSVDTDGTPFANGKGWMANSRIGTTGIHAGTQTGEKAQWVTGHIKIDPTIDNVIRLKNVLFDTASTSDYHGLALFNASFERIPIGSADSSNTWLSANSSFPASDYGMDVVLDGTSIVQFTLNKGNILYEDVKYFAICCGHLSDSSVITINEEIVDIEDDDSNYYSVDSQLTNAVLYPEVTQVEKGAMYTASLAALNGTITSVVVTMDGQDITESVYYASTGRITIPAVTGDVTIVAIAQIEEEEGYTNVISTSIDSTGAIFNKGKGWAANGRIGSGTLENYIGGGDYYITGHIEIDPTIDNVIRLRNITFKSDTTIDKIGIAFYDANFARVAMQADNSSSNWLIPSTIANAENGFAVVYDGTNILQFTLKADDHTTNHSAQYMAICAEYIGDDSIITVNEEL